MTSSNGNIFCVTGALCGEFTGHRWIPPTKASNAELWCFLWSAPWINSWVNNREAGDLRRHRAHHDVTLMRKWISYVVCKKVIILFRAQYVKFSRLETAISVFQMGSNNRVFFLQQVVQCCVENNYMATSGNCILHVPRNCFISEAVCFDKLQCLISEVTCFDKLTKFTASFDKRSITKDKNQACFFMNNE